MDLSLSLSLFPLFFLEWKAVERRLQAKQPQSKQLLANGYKLPAARYQLPATSYWLFAASDSL